MATYYQYLNASQITLGNGLNGTLYNNFFTLEDENGDIGWSEFQLNQAALKEDFLAKFLQQWDTHQVVQESEIIDPETGLPLTSPVDTGSFKGSGSGYYIDPVSTFYVPSTLFGGQQYYLEPEWKNVGSDGWKSTVLDSLAFIIEAGKWSNNTNPNVTVPKQGGTGSNEIGDKLYYSFKAGNGLFDNVDNVSEAHTLYGPISSITIGYDLQGTGIFSSSVSFDASKTLLTISGLDTGVLNNGFTEDGKLITKDGKIFDAATGNVTTDPNGPLVNDTHEIVWGLMSGNAKAAFDKVFELVSAGLLTVEGDLSLLGIQEATDAELALAA